MSNVHEIRARLVSANKTALVTIESQELFQLCERVLEATALLASADRGEVSWNNFLSLVHEYFEKWDGGEG